MHNILMVYRGPGPTQTHAIYILIQQFEIMRYGRNISLKESTTYFPPNWKNTIEEKETLRDLGVIK